ncbi:MAG: restriction endonuclease subunit S [Flavobacteriaceae bacterium]|nr:restriction endonuclease subunit S [Flavobacteriaceae bacterium]|tara:strand:- start:21972 stop:23174 length:1203 start_codon:yes stop_codon:yes gene_type:complete
MSELKSLLEGVKVDWKPMWEVTTWDKKFNAVANYKQPKTIKYKHLLAKKIKELISDKGDIKILTTNETDLWTTSQLADSLISEGEVVAIPWGGNAVVQYYNGKFVTGDNRIAVSNDTNYLDTKYLYYFMLNNIRLLSSFYRGSGIKHPSMSKVLEMKVPIPPLNNQKEIVRILDTFTELTTELTTELSNRKKQFEYYREQLLTFDEKEVEWKTLGEIGEVRMCKRILKNQTTSIGDIPFYKIGTFGKSPNAFIPKQLFKEYKSKYNYPKIGEVLISASGTIGRAVIFNGEDAYFQDSNIVWIENDESLVLNKYLFYYYQIAKWKTADGGTIKRLYNNDLKKTKIQIPSIKEQERIVSILDQFDTLTNSISEGLPKEIELRTKQYEYYREKLLTFPKETVK